MFAQLVWGTQNVMIIAFIAGLATTAIAVLVGIAAAYLGGLWDASLSVLTDVLLVIPLFPLLIVIAGYAHGGGTLVLIIVHHRSPAGPTPRASSASQALTLRNRDFLRGGPGARRAPAVHHRGRGHPHDDLADRGELPDQRAVRGAVRVQPAVHRARRPEHGELGHDALLGAEQRGAADRRARCGRWRPAPASPLLGAAFALLNYAFDEIGNPALRPVRR